MARPGFQIGLLLELLGGFVLVAGTSGVLAGFAMLFLVAGAATGIVSVFRGMAERTRTPGDGERERRDHRGDPRED